MSDLHLFSSIIPKELIIIIREYQIPLMMDNVITQMIDTKYFQHQAISDVLCFINSESGGILVCHPVRDGPYKSIKRRDIYKWQNAAWHQHDTLKFKNSIFDDLCNRYARMRFNLMIEMRDSCDVKFRNQTEMKIEAVTRLITRIRSPICRMNIWNSLIRRITKVDFDPNVPY